MIAALTELAAAYGVATEYLDWQERPVTVPADGIVAVLAAMGVDASSQAAIDTALAERRSAPLRSLLPPCWVVRQPAPAPRRVYLPTGHTPQLRLTLEDGTTRDDVRLTRTGPAAEPGFDEGQLQLPPGLPLGWHTLDADGQRTALAVTPARLPLPEPAWGFMLQLYSVPSARSWAFGDLGDLAELAAWSGRDLGAGFIVVNPVHAGVPVHPVPNSPYLPSSRRYVDPLYLRIEAVPEASRPFDRPGPAGELIDRDAVWAAKRAALEKVYLARRTPQREAAYHAYLDREGQALVDYATWCAIAGEHGPEWTGWPAQLRDPRSAAVAAARERLAAEVEFHCWLQWLLDEQLASAQRAATDAGMPIGVIHDLAVGTAPAGADAWALQRVLANGVSVGAPPDAFNQQGQNWSQPPWHPEQLAAAAYQPYRQMVAAVLRHAGGIRIDHVLGLSRLWWIPAGVEPLHGTYVQYDRDALIGILALEAHRAGALVIGEDLGTVAPGTREYLDERGVFGTSVLWFEKTADGAPLPPQHWRERSLATLTTHDLPTTPAALTGEHIDLRARLGLLTRSVDEERQLDAAERAAWLRLLHELGLVEDESEEGLTVALHRFLGRTPARLIGVSLPDAVGERRPQNLPGTSDEYPNWRIPLADGAGRPVMLEQLPEIPLLHRLVDAVRRTG